MTPRKQCFTNITGLICIWTQKMWQHSQDLLKFRPNKIPAPRGNGNKIPPLPKWYLWLIHAGRGKNKFFQQFHWVYQLHSKLGPYLWVLGQQKSPYFVWDFFARAFLFLPLNSPSFLISFLPTFFFVLSLVHLYLLILMFCCFSYFIYFREKMNLVGRWDWKDLGGILKGKCDQNVLHENCFK